jgi:hypothetical protein
LRGPICNTTRDEINAAPIKLTINEHHRLNSSKDMAFHELSLLGGAQLHGSTESFDQVLRLEAYSLVLHSYGDGRMQSFHGLALIEEH